MMKKKNKMMRFTIILFSIAFIGCSGGGSNSSNSSSRSSGTPTPSLEVLPAADFDFGTITDANSVAPLVVTIRNSGTADLSVSDITLSDTVNFGLDVNAGVNSCGSTAPTIGAGSSCTVTVDFTPPVPPPFGTFSSDLTIRSNDPTTPTYTMSLLGTTEDITALDVKINQVDACPRSPSGGLATVYVSVTDQGGFPVTTLMKDDFTLTEDGDSKTLATAVSVDDKVTLSVALLMDYSYSITQEPENVTDMQNAVIGFVDQLGVNDEAEIIKYATNIEVTQPFTSDETLLTNAIKSTPNVGGTTALYDAIVKAVNDISTSEKDRRAIIIITDGEDNDGSGNPLSDNTLADVIADANANGVPVFTVGLGDRASQEKLSAILKQLADDTGGTFSDSATSANLVTIYQQLAALLFSDQYILTYTSGLASSATGDLTVTATYTPPDPDVVGSDTKTIPACP